MKKHLRANPIFYYSKEENQINCQWTLLIGAVFFMIKKLCELYFIFRTQKEWVMALFDVDFVFYCPCFVSDVQHGIVRSTKTMKLVPMLMVNMSLRTLKLIILRMKSLFLSAILIILWTVCVSILKIVFTIPGRTFFECNTIILAIKLKSGINVTE